jgi:predicted O-methyltransferase YrrM
MVQKINGLTNVEFIIPEMAENMVLQRLDKAYCKIIEMSQQQQQFLNSLILRKKPLKVLELGVSAGGSSIVILNALKEIPGSKLYSVDAMEKYYKTKEQDSGFFVDNYPDLKANWQLFTGGWASKFIEQIGGDIDFCLIDTMHSNPGEILDFLIVLPYLKADALVVFHDVKLNTKFPVKEWAMTNNLLMSAIHGKKILQGNFTLERNGTQFPNIAAIELNSETSERIYEVFNLLTVFWKYCPKKSDYDEFVAHCEKFYPAYYIQYLEEVYQFHKQCVRESYKQQSFRKEAAQMFNKLIIKRIEYRFNKAFRRK